MKKILALIPALSLAFGISCASAANIKVGTIDLPQILQQSPQIAVINNKLKSQFAPQQQKIIAAQNNLRTESVQLNPNGQSKLSSADQQKLQMKIANDQKQLQQMIVSFQQNVSSAQTKALNSFMNEVSSTVQSIAQKQSLDLVLLKPAVVYSPNTVDITSQVLQALPKQ